jgi:methionyl aminopeptidase
MAITIKNKAQIDLMRAANQIVARTHSLLEGFVKPGITTGELDRIAEEYILSQGAYPAFKGYGDPPFPAATCISVNEEVIHGIPGIRKLNVGDIVSIDIGTFINGYHGDAARTHAVGAISEERRKLIYATRLSFFNGIKFARAGRHLNEIGSAIQDTVESYGYSVVEQFVGHGIGKKLHEDPQIHNYRQAARGPRLYPGMTLAIEPMVNEGTGEVKILNDKWTVVTKDKKCSAHYENTILVTDGEPEILSMC